MIARWPRRQQLLRNVARTKIQRGLTSDLGVIPPGKSFTVIDYSGGTVTILVDGLSYLVGEQQLRRSAV